MPKTERTAPSAYRNHIRDCHALLAVIEDLLEEEACIPDTEVSWGHVGSMYDVRDNLISLLIPWRCDDGGCEDEARARIKAAMKTKQV